MGENYTSPHPSLGTLALEQQEDKHQLAPSENSWLEKTAQEIFRDQEPSRNDVLPKSRGEAPLNYTLPQLNITGLPGDHKPGATSDRPGAHGTSREGDNAHRTPPDAKPMLPPPAWLDATSATDAKNIIAINSKSRDAARPALQEIRADFQKAYSNGLATSDCHVLKGKEALDAFVGGLNRQLSETQHPELSVSLSDKHGTYSLNIQDVDSRDEFGSGQPLTMTTVVPLDIPTPNPPNK